MMVGNLIKCEKCGRELQPEDILVGKELIPICRFCGKMAYDPDKI